MHAYSTNCQFQPRLIATIAFASLVISTGIGWVATGLNASFGIPAGGVSAMAVFGGLYFAFDRWLWKLRLVRSLLLVPDLNGEWVCTGRTLWKDGAAVSNDWSGTITIKQSWSKIAVILKTEQSGSRSLAASMHHQPGEGFRLIYHYDNTQRVDERELGRHCGAADLMINDTLDTAEGNYFTDHCRHTAGTMSLRKGKQ